MNLRSRYLITFSTFSPFIHPHLLRRTCPIAKSFLGQTPKPKIIKPPNHLHFIRFISSIISSPGVTAPIPQQDLNDCFVFPEKSSVEELQIQQTT
jgi:hypothetical protein